MADKQPGEIDIVTLSLFWGRGVLCEIEGDSGTYDFILLLDTGECAFAVTGVSGIKSGKIFL